MSLFKKIKKLATRTLQDVSDMFLSQEDIQQEELQYKNSIVFRLKRVVYFPIPKNACSSIKRVFAQELQLPKFVHGNSVSVHSLDFPWLDRSERQKCREYFSFAVVRNPWDRVVAAYDEKIKIDTITDQYFINGVHFMWEKMYPGVFRANMPFPEFVQAISMLPNTKKTESHLRQQHFFICNKKGKPLVSYLARFENLERDWQYIASRTGLPSELPHMNKSTYENYLAYYDSVTQEIIAKMYAEDIRIFGYTFDGSDGADV